MIKYFSKNSYRWSILGSLLILVLSGCVLTNPKAEKSDGSNNVPTIPSSNVQGEEQKLRSTDESIFISKNNQDLPGSLSSKTTLGPIHIGNTKSEVLRALGNPDVRNDDGQTGYENWIYKKQVLTVQFYRSLPDMPPSSVVNIQIGAGSDLKTDTFIGISDTLVQIKKTYPTLNANEDLTMVWVNGGTKTGESGFTPTLSFKLKENTIQEIKLSNKGNDPGPIQQKPLSLADLEVGGIQIGGTIDNVVKQYGQPSEKTIAHGLGTPYWIFKKQGLTIDFGGPIWHILVMSPFKGSTRVGFILGAHPKK
ncbi:hypothetical protein JCM16418_3743 [Paenibacillus pini JCM 16418]|uniref:Lipoprotein n=1 Tax=Paenibacillus pini JCM 16418 TaxID=1236976 RepID=W7YMD9_9BACL|nr:hypothetical protein JCM16418_3743 [Paenibacillus pini JCM 16418]